MIVQYIILIIIGLLQCKLIPPRNILTSINCGSQVNVHSSYGVYFQMDINYTKSFSKDYNIGSQNTVKYTEDISIFMTQRYSNQNFTYYINIPMNQQLSFVVILLFAEFQFNKEGERVFDIFIGDLAVIKQLDIYKQGGQFSAINQYIPLQFDGKEVLFGDQKCHNALDQEGNLLIIFAPNGQGDAIVNGIMIVKGRLEDTNFEDQIQDRIKYNNQYQKEREKENIDKNYKKTKQMNDISKNNRNKQILKIRPGFEHQIDPEDIQKPVKNKQRQSNYPPFTTELIIGALKTPFGILGVIAFFIMMFILISFAFFDPYGMVNDYQFLLTLFLIQMFHNKQRRQNYQNLHQHKDQKYND